MATLDSRELGSIHTLLDALNSRRQAGPSASPPARDDEDGESVVDVKDGGQTLVEACSSAAQSRLDGAAVAIQSQVTMVAVQVHHFCVVRQMFSVTVSSDLAAVHTRTHERRKGC